MRPRPYIEMGMTISCAICALLAVTHGEIPGTLGWICATCGWGVATVEKWSEDE